jgi:hypothetical protein
MGCGFFLRPSLHPVSLIPACRNSGLVVRSGATGPIRRGRISQCRAPGSPDAPLTTMGQLRFEREPAPTEHAMTPRQTRFVAEYLIDLNASQAAIRAGYSAHTAEQQGPRLLGNVEVAAVVLAKTWSDGQCWLCEPW